MSDLSLSELERQEGGFLPARDMMQTFTFNVLGSPGAFASVTTAALTGGQTFNVTFTIIERDGGSINI